MAQIVLTEEQTKELLIRQQVLIEELLVINRTLSNAIVLEIGKDKVDIVKKWVEFNPDCTRAQFMSELAGIGSSDMMNTYWQNHKPRRSE